MLQFVLNARRLEGVDFDFQGFNGGVDVLRQDGVSSYLVEVRSRSQGLQLRGIIRVLEIIPAIWQQSVTSQKNLL